MSQRTKIEYALKLDRCDLPSNPHKFIAVIQEAVNKIPLSYLGSTKIEISMEYDYDSQTAELQVSYNRPFTDEELAAEAIQIKNEKASRRLYFENELRNLNEK